jgi:hypothetical protein
VEEFFWGGVIGVSIFFIIVIKDLVDETDSSNCRELEKRVRY